MSENNPIQLIKELNFGGVFQRADHIFIDMPAHLNISPNGQHIALSNEENMYMFNLKYPELSWSQGVAMELANGVVPTDSGGYWIQKCDEVQFVNKHGEQALKMSCPLDYSLWGNDDWLLMSHEKQLKYTNTSDFFIHVVAFKQMLLHAWEYGDGLRLLSVSRRKKKLFLYEWDCDRSEPKRISTYCYHQDLQFSKKASCHMHAWTLEDKTVLIKLIPWAITVSDGGKVSVSRDHIAWHPIMMDKKPEVNINRGKLAELTACALDQGMAASQGFNSQVAPFLITTLLQNDSIHFISTEWHKRLSIRHINALTDKHLDACLGNHDVVSLLLANSERPLVSLQEKLPKSLMHMLEEGVTEYQFKRLLDQRHSQISRLFELYFPKIFNQQLDQSKEYLPAFLSHMHKNLQMISLRPLLVPVFFDYWKDECVLCDDDKEYIDLSLKTLIPILPEYIRDVIPDRLLKDALSFCQTLTEVDLPTAGFLIAKAPDNIFDFEVFIFILNTFPSVEDIMIEILIYRKHLWSKHDSLDSKTRSRLVYALNNMFHCGSDFNEMLLPMVIAHQIFTTEHLESVQLDCPLAHLIFMLVQDNMSICDIAAFLACQTATGSPFAADVIEPEIEIVQSRRLIPSVILTMLGISNARVFTDLLVTLEICPVADGCLLNIGDPRFEDKSFVITTIWRQCVSLDEQSQWAFAVILLSAITRCLSKHEIASLFTGHTLGSSLAYLTEEALLLQKNSSKALLPIDEMLVCISSHAGMNEVHKKTSIAILKLWKEG